MPLPSIYYTPHSIRPRARRWAGMCLLFVSIATGCLQAEHIYVLFTVDVESTSKGSPERDIWGRLPGEPEEHGIGRMMDIFGRHGVKSTFFVNVYEAAVHGEEVMVTVCRSIHQRGHDIELHTHPDPIFDVYAMKDANTQKQEEILRAGVEFIKRATGQIVIAHRAGGYLANYDTLVACRQVGIMSEYSHNRGYHGEGFAAPPLTTNKAVVYDGVLCIPVTNYVQAGLSNWKSIRFLDIEASSPQEIKEVVRQLQSHGVRTVVIMMHSFSFSRFGEPNERVERALDDLLGEFVADPDIRVVTARQLYEIWRKNPEALKGRDYLPTTGWWMTYCRAWQRLGEGWKNVVVALTPPGGVVLVIGTGLIWRHRRRRRELGAAA